MKKALSVFQILCVIDLIVLFGLFAAMGFEIFAGRMDPDKLLTLAYAEAVCWFVLIPCVGVRIFQRFKKSETEENK
ncbi:MAG: hypothetical protein K6A33_00185 [Clostridiales bacterium]|nr:hypothetical protein [Clostridiales bacterium]